MDKLLKLYETGASEKRKREVIKKVATAMHVNLNGAPPRPQWLSDLPRLQFAAKPTGGSFIDLNECFTQLHN